MIAIMQLALPGSYGNNHRKLRNQSLMGEGYEVLYTNLISYAAKFLLNRGYPV